MSRPALSHGSGPRAPLPEHDRAKPETNARVHAHGFPLVSWCSLHPMKRGRALAVRAGPDREGLIKPGVPDCVTHLDPEGLRQSAIDLEHGNIARTAIDGRFIQGDRRGMHVGDPTCGIDEDHIQRDQSVAHPEGEPLGGLVKKQHARPARHGFAPHEALGSLCTVIGNFDAELCGAPITGHGHMVLRAGARV